MEPINIESQMYTYLVFLVTKNRGQQHAGHILDIVHWHLFYALPGQSGRITPPVY